MNSTRKTWAIVGFASLFVAAASMWIRHEIPTTRPDEAMRFDAARERARAKIRAFDQPDRALDHYLAQRLPIGASELPVERYARARARRSAMPQVSLHPTLSKFGAPIWQQSGPDDIGGRTRDLVFDPDDAQTMYAASVSGGVWISRDGAQSWNPAGEELANLAVVSLAFEPGSGRLFAGTGEGVYVNRPVSRSRGVRGDGIFTSSDRGASWTQLPATAGRGDFDYVNDLVFDAAGRLYAATRAGVQVSDDGGVSFAARLQPGNVEGCTDLAVAADAGTVLVSCGAHSPGGIWVSADHGQTWNRTLGDATTGRSSLAVSRSDSRIVYALVADPVDQGMRRVARSNNGGLTWETRAQRGGPDLGANLLLSNALGATNDTCTAVAFYFGQGWFDNVIAVDPTDPDVVWAGGVDLQRSDDGGRRFRFASRWYADPSASDYVHADQHVIAFHPDYDGAAQRRLFVANDGGVHSTDSPQAATQANPCALDGIGVQWQARNRGYFATQFYHGDVSSDGSLLAGGAQDNGTIVGPPLQPSAWNRVFGGDGITTRFDPRDRQRAYFGSQFAFLNRSDDGFATSTTIIEGLPLNGTNSLFITPFTLDPQNPDTLYTGGRAVFRSVNRGDQWNAISAAVLDPSNGLVSALDVAPDDADRLVIGFSSGTVAISDNARAPMPTWRTSLPRAGFVSGITQAPGGNAIYLTYSTFGGHKVFRSSDAGASWQPLGRSDEADGLPDVPVHNLLIDPTDSSRLLLGTDIGLFVGLDHGARWAADASGLGNVLVERLVTAQRDGIHSLHAFTYGRGVLSADLPALPNRGSNPGWTGLWFDPAQVGQGFQIEIVPDTDTAIVGWYTHLPAAAPRTRNSQLWMTGAGTLRDGTAELVLQRGRGRFDLPGSTLQTVGTLRLRFINCQQADVEFDVEVDGIALQGTRQLQRLVPDAVCERFRQLGDAAISTLPSPANPSDLHYGSTGTWFDPATAGQGMLLEYLPASEQLALSWYAYDFTDVGDDAAQPPLWLTAIGPAIGNRAELTVSITRGGALDSDAAVTQSNVGTLTLTMLGCDTAEVDYDLVLDGENRSGDIALQRLTPPALCRRVQ